MSAPTSFVIERSKWLRGEGGAKSHLLRPADGKMCCLGQVALQCGIKRGHISGKVAPCRYGVYELDIGKWPGWFYGPDRRSDDVDDAMSANDAPNIGDAEREERLAGIFAKHGATLTFID